MGGFDRKNSLASVHKFKLGTGKFEECAPLNKARHLHSTCACSFQLYVVGGYCSTDDTTLRSIEFYDPNVKSWQLFDDILSHAVKRPLACATKIDDSNAYNLLVLGGESSDGAKINACHLFDAKVNEKSTSLFEHHITASNAYLVGDMSDRVFAMDLGAKATLLAYDFNCKTGKITQVSDSIVIPQN